MAGVTGGVFGLASIIGPTLGGWITQKQHVALGILCQPDNFDQRRTNLRQTSRPLRTQTALPVGHGNNGFHVKRRHAHQKEEV